MTSQSLLALQPFTPAAIVVLGLTLVCGSSISAAERVWDGGAAFNSNWTDPANWTSRGTASAPDPGDDLRFPAGALRLPSNNNFPANTDFNLLTYAGAGYTAAGNEIDLTGGILV